MFTSRGYGRKILSKRFDGSNALSTSAAEQASASHEAAGGRLARAKTRMVSKCQGRWAASVSCRGEETLPASVSVYIGIRRRQTLAAVAAARQSRIRISAALSYP